MGPEKKLTIGIVCDNYKVDMFKAELAKSDIEIVSITPFNANNTIIRVLSQQDIVAPVTIRVERHFNMNKKTRLN